MKTGLSLGENAAVAGMVEMFWLGKVFNKGSVCRKGQIMEKPQVYQTLPRPCCWGQFKKVGMLIGKSVHTRIP